MQYPSGLSPADISAPICPPCTRGLSGAWSADNDRGEGTMSRGVGSFFVPGLALAAATVVMTPSAGAGTDVTTYAYDLQRTGDNPQETVIGTGNAGALALQWSTSVGGPITTQPLV